jgi:hypothetical protein
MKTIKTLSVALAATVLSFGALPSAIGSASGGGGGGGGGTVVGKCGTLSGVTASASGGTVQVRGTITNCSIYLQGYYVEISEPTNTAACAAHFTAWNILMSSGSRQSFSASGPGCSGTHTLKAVLKSRTDASVLSTASVTYTG